jgi:hypothetical protein
MRSEERREGGKAASSESASTESACRIPEAVVTRKKGAQQKKVCSGFKKKDCYKIRVGGWDTRQGARSLQGQKALHGIFKARGAAVITLHAFIFAAHLGGGAAYFET